MENGFYWVRAKGDWAHWKNHHMDFPCIVRVENDLLFWAGRPHAPHTVEELERDLNCELEWSGPLTDPWTSSIRSDYGRTSKPHV